MDIHVKFGDSRSKSSQYIRAAQSVTDGPCSNKQNALQRFA